jgi:ABC-2 type transport system permease protein
MRGYWRLFAISVRTAFAYRLNAFISWMGSIAYLVTSFAIWKALLAGGPIGGYDWAAMQAYLLIGWATIHIGGPGLEWRMADRILWGEVASDLTKPVDYQLARFSEHCGALVFELAAIGIAAGGAILLTGGVAPPEQAGLFVLSLLLVIPLKFVITYITCMVCFWTSNYMGVSWAKNAVIMLFSGGLIPLALLPSWLSGPAAVLPFASITATPAALYLGQATGQRALELVAIQLFWIVLLWVASRLLWRGALRALTIHGG